MPEKPKIAAIVTTYFPESHADLIVSKFARGFSIDTGRIKPQVDLVSMYIDQFHWADVGTELGREYGIEIYPSVRGAVTLTRPSTTGHWPTSRDWQDGELAVDGVLLIGEHGDYAANEHDQRLYPRRQLFEQVAGVMGSSGRAVPIFNDKHLSYNWSDALWMFNRAKELKIPFMAGSSLPLVRRQPELDHEIGTNIEEALSIGYINWYHTGLDSYGFHALEALQCMVERRQGGETGVSGVQCLEGNEVWRAGDEGLWSRELAGAAESLVEPREFGDMDKNCESPVVFIVDYVDGLRACSLILPGHLQGFGYAARVNGQIQATGYNPNGCLDHAFSYLGLNIHEMFLTGQPQYPVERTLLVSGMLEALMESRYKGHTYVTTPHLKVAYCPYVKPPIRPVN